MQQKTEHAALTRSKDARLDHFKDSHHVILQDPSTSSHGKMIILDMKYTRYVTSFSHDKFVKCLSASGHGTRYTSESRLRLPMSIPHVKRP